MDKIIYLITNEPFPIGLAATNRIISYGKGFVENNANVKVICLKSNERAENHVKNDKHKGKYHGIEFEYVCGTTLRGKTFLRRRYLVLKGLFIAFFSILKNKTKISVILMYTTSFGFLTFFFLVAKLLSIKYLLEGSEFPPVLINPKYSKNFILKIYAKIYVSFVYKLFDGMLIITNPLINYYKKKCRNNVKILQVPITVEVHRFQNSYENKIKNSYIAYCGRLDRDIDGVSILIKSFEIISKKFKDVRLVIIGDAQDPNDFYKLKRLTENLKIETKVIFTGRISRDEVPEYLCNATILALARPTSLQATGGFPSKLGEYLSTGNPVVTTKVGDIPLFLKDRVNSFLSEPNCEKAFADKLDYVLSNPETAREVGSRGRDLAAKKFNYKYQAKRVLNFMEAL